MRLILTGGGTGGHIFPNIAIVEEAYRRNSNSEIQNPKQIQNSKFKIQNLIDVLYIGSKGGMEKDIIEKINIPYKGIFCGKLRRYFSWQNFIDWLKIPLGIVQSFFIIKKFNPDIIFSKGGYVSVPVVVAGYLSRKKIIIHDSDSIPGLTTKICAKFCSKICLAYKEAGKYLPASKIEITGIPLRNKIPHGNKNQGLKLCRFNKKLPIVLIFGGSLGSRKINELITQELERLLTHCQIVHLAGENKLNTLTLKNDLAKRYCSFQSVGDRIADLYAIADLVVSRAGANAIAEIQTLGLPSILIPLGLTASHGDQIKNAEILEQAKGCVLKPEKNLVAQDLADTIISLLKDKNKLAELKKNAKTDLHLNAAKKIIELLITNSKIQIPSPK